VLKGVKNKTKKKITWPSRLHIYSNHRTAQSKAYKYLGRTAKLYPGTNSQKNIPYLIKKITIGLILVKWDMKILQNITIKGAVRIT